MNDAILSLLIGSSAGIIGLLIRYSYYSKCDVIECCYCCKIHRQVVNEINDDNPKNNNDDINIDVKPTHQNNNQDNNINVRPPQNTMIEPKKKLVK